ncbi:hypothetical protein Adeg_0705 [Ammonifex degensii KC4]|uniref:Uncharacterized protein n=1 Tax=Ammonifex degensii (strain DSM 10501 / KC4) TaxID=429009 RepID=C9RC75_AMMDK|nr:hypothetical protein [Ammonifex degensii]ACX51852.1 hypothetical protein Adeg_0705 [Ammonifex degensii KC4]
MRSWAETVSGWLERLEQARKYLLAASLLLRQVELGLKGGWEFETARHVGYLAQDARDLAEEIPGVREWLKGKGGAVSGKESLPGA